MNDKNQRRRNSRVYGQIRDNVIANPNGFVAGKVDLGWNRACRLIVKVNNKDQRRRNSTVNGQIVDKVITLLIMHT